MPPKSAQSTASGNGGHAATAPAPEPLTLAPQINSPKPKPEYTATILPGFTRRINPKMAEVCAAIEATVKKPLWVLVQKGMLNDWVFEKFFEQRALLKKGEEVALLIDSPGGLAPSAYRLADFLRKHCGGFTAIVPHYAKSAATLLTLGADTIIMGQYAELGPLDVQVEDMDREERSSALNEVQALERLHETALQEIDSTSMFLLERTRKKADTLLPLVLKFVADMKKPLLEKIDTVHYTQMSRQLRQVEEYATRLLEPKYGQEKATLISKSLVHKYSDHSFIIDANEAINQIRLDVKVADEELEELFCAMRPILNGDENFIGKIIEKGTKENGKD